MANGYIEVTKENRVLYVEQAIIAATYLQKMVLGMFTSVRDILMAGSLIPAGIPRQK